MVFKAVFLHGVTQNAKIMANDFEPMKKLLSKILEITYLDAPYHLNSYPVFLKSVTDETDEELRKMEAESKEHHYKSKGMKGHYGRTWYFTDMIGNYSPQIRDCKVLGLEESLDFIFGQCKKVEADGLIGFSQGSLMATLLALRVLNDPNSEWKPKFCILFSSPFPHCYELARALSFCPQLDLPSLHVMGRYDDTVPNSRSLTLSDRYLNPIIHYHDGAHTVPHTDDISVYQEFFQKLEK